jgi:hypothetical protein
MLRVFLLTWDKDDIPERDKKIFRKIIPNSSCSAGQSVQSKPFCSDQRKYFISWKHFESWSELILCVEEQSRRIAIELRKVDLECSYIVHFTLYVVRRTLYSLQYTGSIFTGRMDLDYNRNRCTRSSNSRFLLIDHVLLGPWHLPLNNSIWSFNMTL